MCSFSKLEAVGRHTITLWAEAEGAWAGYGPAWGWEGVWMQQVLWVGTVGAMKLKLL